jgi:hypothetical protein
MTPQQNAVPIGASSMLGEWIELILSMVLVDRSMGILGGGVHAER